jgi:hypothetical protein
MLIRVFQIGAGSGSETQSDVVPWGNLERARSFGQVNKIADEVEMLPYH